MKKKFITDFKVNDLQRAWHKVILKTVLSFLNPQLTRKL